MKGFIVSSLAVFSLTALSACAPYNWEKDYGNGSVSLDGPLRKHVTYVKGTTSFADATPAGMAMPARSASFAAPGMGSQNLGVSTTPAIPSSVIQAATTTQSSGFVAPITAAPSIPTASFPLARTATSAQPAADVRVPPAFINAGQSANLQTRRVGDAGIVVFSDMIDESVAKSAASRSCAQEGKSSTPTDAVEVATGVKQVNFSCS